MNDNTVREKILVVSSTESFLASGLVSKLTVSGLSAVLSKGEIKDLEREKADTELIVLFIGEDTEEMADSLVYLKDMAADKDLKLILIGDADGHDAVLRIIPDTLILEWFKRPLVMDELIKSIVKYMEENTGEKRKKTILIVDDDITYMRTVYEWLKESYHVGMAANGVQAISYLARNKADLVLLDYEMPVANGPKVLEMLKNDTETGQIPVIFLTGHGDRDSVLSVVDLKPEDYLLKTIDKNGLLSKLNSFFEANRKY